MPRVVVRPVERHGIARPGAQRMQVGLGCLELARVLRVGVAPELARAVGGREADAQAMLHIELLHPHLPGVLPRRTTSRSRTPRGSQSASTEALSASYPSRTAGAHPGVRTG